MKKRLYPFLIFLFISTSSFGQITTIKQPACTKLVMKKLLKDKKSFEVFLDLTCLHILDTLNYLEKEKRLFFDYYTAEYNRFVPFIRLFDKDKIDSIFKINFTYYFNLKVREMFVSKILTKHLENRRKLYKLFKSIVLNYNNYFIYYSSEAQEDVFESYLTEYYICRSFCPPENYDEIIKSQKR